MRLYIPKGGIVPCSERCTGIVELQAKVTDGVSCCG